MRLLAAVLVLALSQAAPPAQNLGSSIDKLGSLDFAVRTEASRLIRRAAPAQAVPALIEAATNHKDGYTRFRALVLLTGFNDARADGVMLSLLADPNDRVRAVAYGWFEHHPNAEATKKMVAALENEASEFVRPALTRALAAADAPESRAAMTALVLRGQDFFRSIVIEALGDYKAAYATKEIAAVTRLDGPLQDDAALALGKIGDKTFLTTLAEAQRIAPRERQPAIAAAICLLGVNCGVHEKYLIDALKFGIANPDYQPLLRSAANGLAALAVSGRTGALAALVDSGLATADPARESIALAIATVSMRNTDAFLEFASTRRDVDALAGLLLEAFDRLEEDLDEERFYATVRRAYWAAAEGSPVRRAAETLIKKLEF